MSHRVARFFFLLSLVGIVPFAVFAFPLITSATLKPASAANDQFSEQAPQNNANNNQVSESQNDGALHQYNLGVINLSVFTTDDAPVTVNVLPQNITSLAHGPASITPTSSPAYGTLSVNSDGTVTYFPTQQFVMAGTKTTDVFSYLASIGSSTYSGKITVTVTETQKAPIATPYSDFAVASSSSNNTFQLPAMDKNSEPLTYSIVTPPAFGTYTLENSTGLLYYTPDYSYVGNDTLTFVASDGHLKSGLGVVRISVSDGPG